MTFPYNLTLADIIAQPWSEWTGVDSLDNGIFLARRKIGHKWTFQGSGDMATAYGDVGTTIPIAECRNFGTVGNPCWRYRYRIFAAR